MKSIPMHPGPQWLAMVQPAQPMTVMSEANTRFAKRITASFHFSTPVTR